jgi:hypothetical protein
MSLNFSVLLYYAGASDERRLAPAFFAGLSPISTPADFRRLVNSAFATTVSLRSNLGRSDMASRFTLDRLSWVKNAVPAIDFFFSFFIALNSISLKKSLKTSLSGDSGFGAGRRRFVRLGVGLGTLRRGTGSGEGFTRYALDSSNSLITDADRVVSIPTPSPTDGYLELSTGDAGAYFASSSESISDLLLSGDKIFIGEPRLLNVFLSCPL